MPRTRAKVPMFRPGQVPPGGHYKPINWPAKDPRLLRLRAYQPKTDVERWDEHGEVCIDLAMRTVFVTALRDREILFALHVLFCFAKDRSYSLQPESLLSGDRIDEVVLAKWRNESSRATYRTRLRKVASAVFPAPQERVYYRNDVAPAHSSDELARFLAASQHIIAGHFAELPTRRSTFRDVQMILALAFGAGVHSRDIHQARESWLSQDADGLWWLDRQRPIATPIPAIWMEMITPHLSGDPDAFLVRPDHGGERNQQVGKVMSKAKAASPGLRGFDVDRAARCWHLRLLKAAHFDVLFAVGGYRPYTTLPLDMVPQIDPTEIDHARSLVRGWLL